MSFLSYFPVRSRQLLCFIFSATLLLSASCSGPEAPATQKITKAGDQAEVPRGEGQVLVGVHSSKYPGQYELAARLLQEHKAGEAIRIYRHLVQIEDSASLTNAYLGLGAAYLIHEEYPEAIAAYRQSLCFDHRNASSYIGMGSAYSKSGALSSAISCYDTASAIDPNNPDPYWGRAAVYRKAGNRIKAKENAGKFLELRPDSQYRPQMEAILNE